MTAVPTLVDSTERLGSGNTVASIPIGAAFSDRIVLLLVLSSDAVMTAATIGGVSATLAQLDIGSVRMTLIWAAVPTGTTASLVTTGATPTYCVGVYSIAGGQLPATAVNGTSGASTSVNTLADGCVIGFSVETPAGTVTWPVLGENFDYNLTTGPLAGAGGVSGASLSPTTTQTPMAVASVTPTAVVAISFPASPSLNVPRKFYYYQRLRRNVG